MNTIVELKPWVLEQCKQYPELKNQIIGFYDLCLDEIEDGSSEQQEVYSCIHDINDLIDEFKQEQK